MSVSKAKVFFGSHHTPSLQLACVPQTEEKNYKTIFTEKCTNLGKNLRKNNVRVKIEKIPSIK